MCYSAELSLFAFLLSYISTFAIFLFPIKTETMIAIQFLSFVSLMQLFDYIFWTNKGLSSINYYITKMAMIVNHLQPIILVLLIYNYKRYVNKNTLILLYFYIATSIVYSINAWNKITYTIEKNKDNGLYWEWNNLRGDTIVYTLFILTLIVAFYENFDGIFKYILPLLALTILFAAMYKNKFKNNITGRFWCYYASLLPIIVFIFSLYDQHY